MLTQALHGDWIFSKKLVYSSGCDIGVYEDRDDIDRTERQYDCQRDLNDLSEFDLSHQNSTASECVPNDSYNYDDEYKQGYDGQFSALSHRELPDRLRYYVDPIQPLHTPNI